MTGALAIAGWELRAAARSHWLAATSAAFASAVVAVVLIGLRGARDLGLAGTGPAAAGLVGLALLLPSLIGMLLASGSIASARERGELAMVLAEPIPRGWFVVGSFLGLTSAVWLVALLGFAAGLMVVSFFLRPEDLWPVLAMAAASLGLAAASVAIGILVSAVARGRAHATGSAIAIWFLLAAGLDLAVVTIVPALGIGAPGLLGAILLNPFESARVLALTAAGNGGAALGPFGSYLAASFGTGGSVALLSAALCFWIAAPLVAAALVVARRDV